MINSAKCPNERREHENNINSGEEIILETELKWRKSKIKDEIKNEGEKNQKRNFLSYIKVRRVAKRNDDQNIEHCPYWPK